MRIQPAYLLLFSASLLVALVPALFHGVDLAVATFFLQPDPPIHPIAWRWVEWINEYTPDTFRVLTILILGGWIIASLVPRLRRWRFALAFVGFSLALGPGLATWAIKEHTLRARPLDVVEFGGSRQFTPALVQANQCNDNCAFVSGHVACGFFFAGLMLLDPLRRRWWVTIGILSGAIIGFARVSVGAHWLSDVLWPFPITLVSSWVVWRLLTLLYNPKIRLQQGI